MQKTKNSQIYFKWSYLVDKYLFARYSNLDELRK